MSRSKATILMTVNGDPVEVAVAPHKTLLEVLREDLGLTGTKHGCELGECGTCTVLLDGRSVKSCTVLAATAERYEVTTIEGLPEDHPLIRAWIEHQVPQCGYCQTGMIMAAVSLLEKTPRPTDADIDGALTNLCRCGTYPRVRRAIHAAAAAKS